MPAGLKPFAKQHASSSSTDRLQLTLASGRELTAAAVVLTRCEGAPVVPAWAEPLLGAQPRVRPGTEVDVRAESLAGQRVAVVGGGMLAASLALAGAERGAARVTLVSRRCVMVLAEGGGGALSSGLATC